MARIVLPVVSFPITAEVQADAIRANLRAIRHCLSCNQPICAAVKANAYGHGLAQVLAVLARSGVERVAVANLAEALQVREIGWTRPLLCLGTGLEAESSCGRIEKAHAILESDIHCTVTTLAEAQLLSTEAQRFGRAGRIEIKVDTGMGRSGVRVDLAGETIAAIARLPALSIEGVYTHFAAADECDPQFTHDQLARFAELRALLVNGGIQVGVYHAANSAAIFRHPGTHLDMARPGLAVYGYWGGPEVERPAGLLPSMRVVGRLATVRQLPAGHGVGYGCTWRAPRASTIGVVPIGYADGYRRQLSNDAVMTLEAVRGMSRRAVRVVGRVSMDQTTVDLTDAGDVRPGDPIVIIDNDPAAPNSVEALAQKLGTIPYEITCLLGNRVRRILT